MNVLRVLQVEPLNPLLQPFGHLPVLLLHVSSFKQLPQCSVQSLPYVPSLQAVIEAQKM